MNYFFSTGAERIAVIEDLRKKDIVFPDDWDAHRTRQRQSKVLSQVFSSIHLVTSTPQSYPGCSDTIQTIVRPPLSYLKAACFLQEWKMSISKVL
jgi:translation initiation factor 2-alpha kinase 4